LSEVKFINKEFFNIHGNKEITVTIKMIADPKATDEVNMKNAAMALDYFANIRQRQSHSWVKEIEVR
jgi:hypothetical protein